ncbi:Uncharacterised protein [Streptococcus pneumoniae]|nr:Uncharacterised protein [Streptococcus pneumoniae]COR29672.1 Uncharacterised protein [Streptococcus pneumoniae]
MPCTIPLTTSNVTIIPNDDAKPKQIFTSPDKNKPTAIKRWAKALSDKLPIKNLLNP